MRPIHTSNVIRKQELRDAGGVQSADSVGSSPRRSTSEGCVMFSFLFMFVAYLEFYSLPDIWNQRRLWSFADSLSSYRYPFLWCTVALHRDLNRIIFSHCFLWLSHSTQMPVGSPFPLVRCFVSGKQLWDSSLLGSIHYPPAPQDCLSKLVMLACNRRE